MRFRSTFVPVLAAVAALAASSAPARADAAFDFLFNTNSVTDDGELFLNLAVGQSGYPRRVVEPILPRLRVVETDLPVVLFLAKQSGRPVDYIVDLRSRRLGWAEICNEVHVPVEVVYRGIDRDPGPPYGKAWGYWKKNRRVDRISDREFAGLVQVQMGSRWSGLSPYEVARRRGEGMRVETLVADKKGRPYRDGDHGRGHGRGGDEGRGKEKDKGNKHKHHGED